MFKMRLALFPLIVKALVVGPLIVKFPPTDNWPEVSVMVCAVLNTPEVSKLIVAPLGHASAMACRSDPAPLSFALVTVIVVGWTVTVVGAEAALVQPEAVTVTV